MAVRVLIVDDQAPFREVARVVVEATDGFEVAAEAETGGDAVRLAGSLHPDLVLMDVNLPDESGTVATGQILAQDGGIVVLLVSTYEESDYALHAAECGAAGYISKSVFSPERLAAAWEAASAR
jgi:DNA-binding NarL/FixJ family response regulator